MRRSLASSMLPLIMSVFIITFSLNLEHLLPAVTQSISYLVADPPESSGHAKSVGEASPTLLKFMKYILILVGTIMLIQGLGRMSRWFTAGGMHGDSSSTRKAERRNAKEARRKEKEAGKVLIDSVSTLDAARKIDAQAISLWMELNNDLEGVLKQYPALFMKGDNDIREVLIKALADLDAARTDDTAKSADYLKAAESVRDTLAASLKKARASSKVIFTKDQRDSVERVIESLSKDDKTQTKALDDVAKFLFLPEQAMQHKSITAKTRLALATAMQKALPSAK